MKDSSQCLTFPRQFGVSQATCWFHQANEQSSAAISTRHFCFAKAALDILVLSEIDLISCLGLLFLLFFFVSVELVVFVTLYGK